MTVQSKRSIRLGRIVAELRQIRTPSISKPETLISPFCDHFATHNSVTFVTAVRSSNLEVAFGHGRRVSVAVQVPSGELVFEPDQVARFDALRLELGLGLVLLRRHVLVILLHQPAEHKADRNG